MRIDGKTALITGGASGLGAACARMIVENGGRVVIADLKANQALCAELGDAAIFSAADVTDTGQLQAAIDMLQKDIKEHPVPVPPAPAYPNKAFVPKAPPARKGLK